jgi:hypothetical protein
MMFWLIILGGAAVMAVLMCGLVRLTAWSMGRSMTAQHQQLQLLLDTRRPIAGWMGSHHDADTRKTNCLRRLDKMRAYIKQCGSVADEHTRNVLISELESIQNEWQTMDW